MVDGRDLRQNNLLKCLVHLPIGFNSPRLFYSEVVEVREDSVLMKHGLYKYSDVAPITLSHDILLDCGGKPLEEDKIVFSDPDNAFPEIRILIQEDRFYLVSGKGKKMSVPIEAVHDFQNLYYALTQRELNVKLEL